MNCFEGVIDYRDGAVTSDGGALLLRETDRVTGLTASGDILGFGMEERVDQKVRR